MYSAIIEQPYIYFGLELSLIFKNEQQVMGSKGVFQNMLN